MDALQAIKEMEKRTMSLQAITKMEKRTMFNIYFQFQDDRDDAEDGKKKAKFEEIPVKPEGPSPGQLTEEKVWNKVVIILHNYAIT